MSTIGDRIKEIRKERGLTQVVFGEMMGVSHSHISKIEANKEFPSDTLIKLICLDFGINESWLRTGEGSKSMNVYFKNIDTPQLYDTLKKFQSATQQGHFVDMSKASTIELLIELLIKEIPSEGYFDYHQAVEGLLKHLLNFIDASENELETQGTERKQQLYELYSQTREKINRCLDTVFRVVSDRV